MSATKVSGKDGPDDSGSIADAARRNVDFDFLPLNMQDIVTDENEFGVRMLDTAEGRNKASMLINKMYAWRGYAGTHKITDDPNRITLTATQKGEVVGTITIGLDSEIGILADELFKPEVDAYRARGAKPCEFIKLAFDAEGSSKESMAGLFHLAVLWAHDIHCCTHIFIEINPRHLRFYRESLGFTLLSEVRMNPRVNAPAYLLCCSLDYIKAEVERVGGRQAIPGERSFYSYFYSPREQAGILARLKAGIVGDTDVRRV